MKLNDSIRPQNVTIYRGGTLGTDAPVSLGGKKPDLWAGPTSRRRRRSGL
jgi:hypothetical protein